MHKLIFQTNFEEKPFLKFKESNDLPKEISLPFLAFSKKWNKNTSKYKIDFNLNDLLEPSRTRLINGHTDETNKPKPDQIIKNTFLQNKKIEKKVDKDGEYQIITGDLYSSNPKFIEELKNDDFSGFSIEVTPFTNHSIYFNEKNEAFIKEALMPFVAVLKGENPAVPNAGIIGNLNFSEKVGYEDIPKKLIFSNPNNNNMDKQQFEELQKSIQESIKTGIDVKFQELEKASKVEFSLDKNLTPEEIFKEVSAKFESLKNYRLVKKEENTDAGEGEAPEETAKFKELEENAEALNKPNPVVKKAAKFSTNELQTNYEKITF
jgi:hypothetical protein